MMVPSLTPTVALYSRMTLLHHDGDRRRFERAELRWHALLCLEVRTLSPADARLALAALRDAWLSSEAGVFSVSSPTLSVIVVPPSG
jgi:hypothetical protein